IGIGRAPGTDLMSADALRRSLHDAVYEFPEDIEDLLTYFGPEEMKHFVGAYSGVGSEEKLDIFDSCARTAQVAARLGLPYVFAAHFAPKFLEEALTIYREEFQPSAYLDKQYVMVGLNVIAQDTDEEAFFEATTMQQFFLNIVRGSHDTLQ